MADTDKTNLAERLKKAEPAIIARWQKRAAEELGTSKENIERSWGGFATKFLNDLESSLDHDAATEFSKKEDSMEPDPLIVEVGVLTRTMLEELDGQKPLNTAQREEILKSVQKRVSDAIFLERKNFIDAEKNLAELNALLQSTPTGVGMVDREFRYIRVNTILAAMNGLTVEEHIGRTVREVLGDSSADFIEPFVNRVFDTGLPQKFEGVIPLPHDNQNYRPILGTFFPIKVGPEIVSVGVTIIDVTDMKAKERQIETTNFLLRSIIDGVDDPTYIKDLDGRVLICNTATAKIYGKTPEQIIGTVAVNEMPAETFNQIMKVEKEVIATGELRKVEETIKLPDGSYRSFLTTKGPYRDPSGKVIGLFGVSKDVTTLKIAADELRRMNAELKRERSMGEQFCTALSHDLRNPISAIRTNIEFLALHPEDKSLVNTSVERIAKITERADTMIEDLLHVYRGIAGNEYPLTKSHCDLVKEIKELFDGYSTQLQNRIVLIAPPEIHAYLDGRAIVRAVENLVTNALKFGQSGKPVTVQIGEVGGQVTVAVKNHGNPIEPKAFAKLFRPFQRLNKGAGKKGWGIGLATVKSIVDAHKGSVGVTSSEPEGTVFTIRIPKNLTVH